MVTRGACAGPPGRGPGRGPPPSQGPAQQDQLEKLPEGCDPDTIRLFIGHIPPSMTRPELDALVAGHGQVRLLPPPLLLLLLHHLRATSLRLQGVLCRWWT